MYIHMVQKSFKYAFHTFTTTIRYEIEPDNESVYIGNDMNLELSTFLKIALIIFKKINGFFCLLYFGFCQYWIYFQ